MHVGFEIISKDNSAMEKADHRPLVGGGGEVTFYSLKGGIVWPISTIDFNFV